MSCTKTGNYYKRVASLGRKAMGGRRSKIPLLQLARADIERLAQAAVDSRHVSGLTHNFYRYPARFSPALVRAAIRAFTEPGDLVLDPFVGGGTTLVEALAAGRNSVGLDISSLAAFVTEVKTSLYVDQELAILSRWAERVEKRIDCRARAPAVDRYEDAGYLRHLDDSRTWRLRKAIAQALESAATIRPLRLEKFARCAVLRTAQWALDGRKNLVTVDQFRKRLRENALEMIQGSRELARAASQHHVTAYCLHRPTAGLENEAVIRSGPPPRLVITSPPYPGVHVLYHRWQIHGGRETPAPFWIAKRLDGAGAAFYTMGDRKAHANGRYFAELGASLRSIAAVCDPDTTIVQVVAFANPDVQLPRYLSTASDAGLEEHFLDHSGQRLWRSVPNRKWYATQRGSTASSQEVVLFHRLRR